MEAFVEAWAGRGDLRADLRNRGYGAKWGVHFELAAHYGFYGGDGRDRVHRAVDRTPSGAVRSRGNDEHYVYTGLSEAGAFERSECIACDD